MSPYRLLSGLAALLLVATGCSRDDEVCSLAPAKTVEMTIDYGKAAVLRPQLCEGVAPDKPAYQWSLDQEVVSRERQHTFLACPRFVGKTQAVDLELRDGSHRARQQWKVTVRDTRPEYAYCSPGFTAREALKTLQTGDYHGNETGNDFKSAVACLDRMLATYPCDIEVAFWAAWGNFVLFAEQAPAQFALSTLSEDALSGLSDEVLDPLIDRFKLLGAETPAGFEAIASKFPVPFMGLPGMSLNPGGEWDRGDILAVLGALQLFKGGTKFLSAYVGSIRFLQLASRHGLGLNGQALAELPYLPDPFQNALILELESDNRFLTLYEGDDGEKRLAAARENLIAGLQNARSALIAIRSETDDQADDFLRYYDCGEDAVCPPEVSLDTTRGDSGEPLLKDEGTPGKYDEKTDVYADLNSNGRYDPAWLEAGPDVGELDSRYTEGEALGTDALAPGIPRIAVSVPRYVLDLLADLAANLEGPGALDLARYLQLSPSQIVQLSLVAGLNIPDIRMSRWFEGPRDPRDFLPLWNRESRLFFVDREEERWHDHGLDQTPDAEETDRPDDTDCVTEQDPNGDNFNPLTNPSDDCDNDEDGLTDETDSSGRSRDLGTEGNGMFDFQDINGNRRHDKGERAEEFIDEGLITGGASVTGAGNERWDAEDIEHRWPKGNDVGGRQVELTRDPPNGVYQDIPTPLVDPIYYFFPDAQFNGVVIFPQPTQGRTGEYLTHNAELMRFVSKLVQARRDSLR